jgi:hypothetical protein
MLLHSIWLGGFGASATSVIHSVFDETPDTNGATNDQPKNQNPARTFHQLGSRYRLPSLWRAVTENHGNDKQRS